MATPKMTLKLLIDKKGERVLFAEATKEFVDFLFHIFSLPLGTLIEFLGSKQMVGCLGKLKDSIHSLNVTYLQPGINRDDIFNPKTCFTGKGFLLSSGACSDGESGTSNAIYRCSNASMNGSYYSRQTCRSNATVYKGAICPDCRGSMNVKMNPILPKKEVKKKKGKVEGGYVKEVVTYMVMDDLVVKPMSTISSIILITKFGVKDLNNLEEQTVYFGKDEGLKLLKSALKSNTVLTKVFLGKVGKGNMSYKRSKCH